MKLYKDVEHCLKSNRETPLTIKNPNTFELGFIK